MGWLGTILAIIGALVVLCIGGTTIAAIIGGGGPDEPVGDRFDYRPYRERHPEQPRRRWRITIERR